MPITPIEKGGAENRSNADERQAAPMAPPDAAAGDPLGRPVENWSEQDVRRVVSSPAYLQSQHADHERAQRMVRAWFEQRFGTDPARVDATGLPVRETQATSSASGGACPVDVRAHTREGGKVEVHAYCRSLPAA